MQTTTNSKPTPAAHHRFHLLDAMRGVAALVVFLYHLPYPALHRVVGNGFLAVDFFFCLSGFVIAFSYERRLAESLTLRAFSIARWIRLYPMYLLGTSLGFLFFLLFDLKRQDPTHLLAHIFELFVFSVVALPSAHLANSPFAFPVNTAAWSLFFEAVANVGFALLVLSRFAGNRVIALLAIISAAALAWWISQGNTVDVGWSCTPSNLLLGLSRLTVSFSIGVLLLRHARTRQTPQIQTRAVPVSLTFALVVLLTIPLAIFASEYFRLATILLFFPAIIHFGARSTVPLAWENACAFLGDLSYPIYLLHLPLIRLFYTPFLWFVTRLHTTQSHEARLYAAFLVPLCAALIAISYWVAKKVDEPLRRHMSRRLLPRRPLQNAQDSFPITDTHPASPLLTSGGTRRASRSIP